MLGEHKGGAPSRVQTMQEISDHARLAGVGRDQRTIQPQRGAIHIPPPAPVAAAQLVHGGVPGDGQQPGPCRRVASESGQVAHGANERVLSEVVGALAVDERST